MALTIDLLLVCLALSQFSSAHRIEILTTTRPDGVFPEFDCNKPADIVFILDGSRMMTWKVFSKQVDFVMRFIEDIDVSKDIVRVGVATISTELRVDFSLNSYERKREIKAALTNITDPKGKANTWLALEYLRKRAFSTENGGRIGVPQIAIILTDNLSKNKEKTVSEARLLHQEQIRVYVIGIEHFDLQEIKEIASKPDNIYISTDMDALKELEVPLRENICKTVCGITPLDVIFVMDQSTNLWNDDIENQFEFVDRFVKDSLIGPKHTQVGLVTFNTNVTNRFYLNQHQQKGDMLDAIKGLKRNYGESYTDRALRFIGDQGFTEEHGGRKGVPHVVILITDGQSSSPLETRNAADELQKSGTIVFVIGVGSGVDVNELQIIAGDTARLFQILSFRALKSVESPLFARICTL